MRAPVFFSSWLKCTLWSRTAENAFTGTLTSPKLIEPLQIALAMGRWYPRAGPAMPRTMPAMARVVVVGGGIGGLACALFLAPRGHDVTILDRDPADLPADREAAWTDWERRGVPQFRHIHLFNARGRNLLRDELPELFAALRAAGAGEIR